MGCFGDTGEKKLLKVVELVIIGNGVLDKKKNNC